MNAPELIDTIKTYQVPQRAAGNIPETTGGGDITEELRHTRQINAMLYEELKKGITARAIYDDDEVRNIRDKSSEFDEIERNASWSD